MKTIHVKERGRFKDGGTIHYVDKNGKSYYKDGRIKSRRAGTAGKIFDRHPNLVDAKELHVNLIIDDTDT